MKRQLICLLLLAVYPLFGSQFAKKDDAYTIRMNNRPLLVLQGKVYTLFDVVKNMDAKMKETNPEMLLSAISRIQFYNAHWREALEIMVQNALIIKEAEELGIEVSDSQMHEEMNSQFGPNLIQTIDSLGLTFEEAKQKAYEDIVTSYMQWIRVYQKALQNASPERLQIAYNNYLKENPLIETYSYQILSIRSAKDFYEEIASKIAPFMLNTNISDIESLVSNLQIQFNGKATIQASKTYHVNASQMSNDHLSILSKLTRNSCSPPVVQNSRQDGAPVMRLFYLLDHQKQEAPSFDQLENLLKDGIVGQEINKIRQEYILKLKKRYRCDREDFYHMIPENYQPFSLE
jgi:hypothetical protein